MMELTYAGIALHELGEISVSQSEQMDPPESPQRILVTLKVKVDFFADSFSHNYGLVQQLRAALRTQHGQLVWTDSATSQDWLNRTVEVTANDMPDEPNAWGTYSMQCNIQFSYVDTENIVTNAQTATFKDENTGVNVQLGAVNKMTESFSTKHFSEYRDQRERVNGAVTMSGYILMPTAPLSLPLRRANLLSKRADMRDALTNAFGRLIYADFNRDVRIESCSFEVDQAVNGINWSLAGNYTLFPDEAGFATVEMDCGQSDDAESGEVRFNFSGRIQATDKDTAYKKLSLVRKGTLALYGFEDTATQRLSQEVKDKWVSANSDDPVGPGGSLFIETAGQTQNTTTSKAWIELSFTEVYRRRRMDILSRELQVQTRDDIRSGLVITTYSGSVTCAAPSMTDAKTLALSAIKSLLTAAPDAPPSEDKSFLVSSSLTYHIRQLNMTVNVNVLPPKLVDPSGSPMEFLKLEFAYEYQSKITDARVYLEMTETASTELFGSDSWDISGFVVASSRSLADSAYLNLVKSRDFYAGRLVRSERLVESKQTARTNRYDGTLAPSILTGFHTVVPNPSMGEVPDSDRGTFQFIKLEFSFQSFRPKTAGAFGVRYTIDCARNFKTFEKVVTISGSVFGPASQIKAMAYSGSDVSTEITTSLSFLDQFLLFTLKLAHPVESRRTIDVEWKPATWTSGTPSVTAFGSVEAVAKLDFSESYELPLPPDATIIECDVTESVSYSTPRFITKNLPGPALHNIAVGMEVAQNYTGVNLLQSIAVIQECGMDPGRRTVRGSVTAAILSVAETWARGKRMLLTGYYPQLLDGSGASSVKAFYPLQAQIETSFVWRAKIDGIVGRTRFGGVGQDRADVTGDTSNVRMYRVSFTYEEILPYYPMS